MLLAVLIRFPHLSLGNKLLKSFVLAGRADESMAEEVFRSWAAIVVFRQTVGYKVFEVSAKVSIQLWRRILRNVEKDLHGMDVAQRRLSVGHLHGSDSQRPNVGFEAVSILLNDFRRHPEWSSNKGIALRLDICELRSNSEVCKLDLSGF